MAIGKIKIGRTEVSGELAAGGLLMIAAIAAIVIDNSNFAPLYDRLLTTVASIQIADFYIEKPLLKWVNDGLMAIFFLIVAIEIKKEFKGGALSSVRLAATPVVAAIGGIAIPAILYLGIAGGDPVAADGWAIPAATDIAFALALLSIFGDRVPPSLRVFLLALAIVDDLAAILIIALFYSGDLSTLSLIATAIASAVLFVLNKRGIASRIPYILVGLLLWVAVLKSGLHATLAGVIIGFALPLAARDGSNPANSTERSLAPWVSFMVLPVFAFFNAGVSLTGFGLQTLMNPISLGIIAGLFIGKQVGVFGLVWLGSRLGLIDRPEDSNYGMVYGAALLAGVGFTMSLFIGGLAFASIEAATQVRFGVITASLLSAVCGVLVLAISLPKTKYSEA